MNNIMFLVSPTAQLHRSYMISKIPTTSKHANSHSMLISYLVNLCGVWMARFDCVGLLFVSKTEFKSYGTHTHARLLHGIVGIQFLFDWFYVWLLSISRRSIVQLMCRCYKSHHLHPYWTHITHDQCAPNGGHTRKTHINTYIRLSDSGQSRRE